MLDFEAVITALRQCTVSLPNTKAHQEMANLGRKFSFKHVDQPKLAAVLILLYPKDNLTHFVLIQRTGHPLDPHKNQISLPGGRQENQENFVQTAIRETFEEVGVSQKEINIIYPISKIYVGASNFLIHPFIGYVESAPAFIPQESEVQEILEIPLTHLMSSDRHKKMDMMVRNVLLKSVPYFDLAEKNVWGATAMILNELKWILGKDFYKNKQD